MLLTGFGPFPGVPRNPSARLARTLAKSVSLPGFRVEGAVLATEWAGVEAQVPHLLSQFKPVLAVHFGVSVQASGLKLERAAHNHVKRHKDASGMHPKRREVMPGSPMNLRTALPVAELAAAMRKGAINARVSNSCGHYLCNDLYYRSLAWTAAHGGDALFVHVPLTGNTSHGITATNLLRAGETILHLATEAIKSPHNTAQTIR